MSETKRLDDPNVGVMDMYAFLILIALALGLSVVLRALDDLIPFRAPAALTQTIAVAVGAGLAWILGYSAFAAFGQELRAEWMHPVLTGLVLVAVGEFTRSLVSALAHRAGEPPVEAAPAPPVVRAA
ncbi:MAG TPA: hypothetical protein VML96_00055 [Egibacteraceae bacterium]|nr:hypothetical protein [Egibacteraceae bacterium]